MIWKATANQLNGEAGKWTTANSDPATCHYLAIKKSIVRAMSLIILNTNGMAKWEDMRLTLSLETLEAASKSQEGELAMLEDGFVYSFHYDIDDSIGNGVVVAVNGEWRFEITDCI
jgi:hypothetical protein